MPLALCCQKAEHDFCNVPCGIMDQAVSILGIKNHLLLLDCENHKCTHIPFDVEKSDLSLVVCNSNAPHELNGGEYASRVKECKEAVRDVNIKNSSDKKSLRFISLEELKQAKNVMSELAYKRGYHVITENDRCLKAIEACKENKWNDLGKLMYESHESLSKYFEVSTPELDYLVTIAKNSKGVYGSRMTGGGFGGCTITLVKKEDTDTLCNNLRELYREKFEKTCSIIITTPGSGSKILYKK